MASDAPEPDTSWPAECDCPAISDWLLIDQERITAFGINTNDPDPLHIDPAYARDHGPFGTTIAFGFLTIALLTYFFHNAVRSERTGYALNYGFDQLRLPNVVPVGARVRALFRLDDTETRGDGRELRRYDVRIEIENDPKPALVGKWLAMWIDDGILHPPPPLGGTLR